MSPVPPVNLIRSSILAAPAPVGGAIGVTGGAGGAGGAAPPPLVIPNLFNKVVPPPACPFFQLFRRVLRLVVVLHQLIQIAL